jgi:hypothetical protein
MLVLDQGRRVMKSTHTTGTGADCKTLTVEPSSKSGRPLLTPSGAPGQYLVLWGATVAGGQVWTSFPVITDLHGYDCTPLQRACDLFACLLKQKRMEDGSAERDDVWLESGAVTCGHLSASTAYCRRHLEKALQAGAKVSFVWDLVPCNAPLCDPMAVMDAGHIQLLQARGGFQKKFGLPRLLAFSLSEGRRRTPIHWFEQVY